MLLSIKDLVSKLETFEMLGVDHINAIVNDSRDGETHHASGKLKFDNVGDKHDPKIIMYIIYGD